jgi:hypothetical protein
MQVGRSFREDSRARPFIRRAAMVWEGMVYLSLAHVHL